MAERKSSTSVQFSNNQFKIMELIISEEDKYKANAEVIRDAFDFFVQKKYPQFLEVQLKRGETNVGNNKADKKMSIKTKTQIFIQKSI